MKHARPLWIRSLAGTFRFHDAVNHNPAQTPNQSCLSGFLIARLITLSRRAYPAYVRRLPTMPLSAWTDRAPSS